MSDYVYRGRGANGEAFEAPVSDDIAAHLDVLLAKPDWVAEAPSEDLTTS